ncbi:hypothetical protein [Tranquillimonas alkanivorans]|uniref:Heme oxygenase n=1 Tax=Tranquillimonas alkanivorans TaxID=441119 RepID=A0A1I5VRW3_9RHOB|nr:hypothetical protein [Tranquillimonas alkanivorans]SFQ10298.1 hypothetical protein SAMN04488047_1356 [Tranquillimonas alkanivorans]
MLFHLIKMGKSPILERRDKEDRISSTRTLRHRLREETSDAHQRVDDLFSTLNLRTVAGLTRFARANHAALEAIQCRPGAGAEKAKALRLEMVVALERDLEALGAQPRATGQGRDYDATAVLYILLGSRAGTRLLHRQWSEATDPRVAAAGSYLGSASRSDDWRDLRLDLARRPAQGREADAAVSDAVALFDLFGAHFRAALSTPEHQHVRRIPANR